MVSEEKMQEEIDKATTALGICQDIERYAELQRIKYSPNREREIDNALNLREEILKLWKVNISELKEIGKRLNEATSHPDILPGTIAEEDMEIPPNLLPNLVVWMRKKGISDAEILECILFMCSNHSGESE